MTDSHDVEYDADDYPYRGNVYGGGCGEDKYDSNSDETPDMYNPLAGIVLHNTNITITGGHVVHDIYGAGALGSVGNKSTINISGGRVGVDGDNDGNVYGAARGDLSSRQANTRSGDGGQHPTKCRSCQESSYLERRLWWRAGRYRKG